MTEFRLQKATLVLTNKCNLNCIYCYKNSSPYVDTINELKKEEWFNVINQLDEMGIKRVSLGGGEPLTYRVFWKVLNYISDKIFYTTLYSNGLLLNKKVIKNLKQHNLKRVLVNLDSVNEETEEYYKGKEIRGKTLEAIVLLKRENFVVSVVPTLTKRTLKEMDYYIPFCVEQLKVDEIEYVPLLLIGRGKDLVEEFLSEEEKEKARKKIQLYKEKYKNVRISMPCGICEAGKSYCAIEPDGSVIPCAGIPNLVAGNVREKPLSEIWYNSNLFKEIRKSKIKGDECLSALLLSQNVL